MKKFRPQSAFEPASPDHDKLKLLDVGAVAELLDCSTRHVFRLSESGRMPPPCRLGTLVRWPRDQLQSWVEAGCPEVGQSSAQIE